MRRILENSRNDLVCVRVDPLLLIQTAFDGLDTVALSNEPFISVKLG